MLSKPTLDVGCDFLGGPLTCLTPSSADEGCDFLGGPLTTPAVSQCEFPANPGIDFLGCPLRTPCVPCKQEDHSPWKGIRVGEASHPGPPPPSFGDPSFCELNAGDLVDIVVRFDGVQCCALWHAERCLTAQLPLCSPGIYTLYGAVYVGCAHGLPLLSQGPDSLVIARPALDDRTFWRLTELCAGIGGISVGMQAADGVALASVDVSELACATLLLNDASVICGDLHSRDIRIKAHLAQARTSCIVGAGIPCQGYSLQGLRRGFADPRSQTFLSVLQLVWHSQAYALVLECVPAIADCPQTMRALQSFAAKAGLQVAQTKLELADQWSTRRHRWWAALVPDIGEPLSLTPWAKDPLGLEIVIPEWPVWPIEQERLLAWSVDEQHAYANPEFGSDLRFLGKNDTVPTLLHSYGSPLSACPCKCRANGFSPFSLRAKGLRGFGVISQALLGPRYLHPQEAALLCTLPAQRQHLADPKAALCLIGQIAAPLQALWIIAQIQNWAAAGLCISATPPAELLARYKLELLQQRHHAWMLPRLLTGGQVTLFHGDDENRRFVVPCSGPTTVQDLLTALEHFRPCGFKFRISYALRELKPCDFVHFSATLAYRVDLLPKRSAKEGFTRVPPRDLSSALSISFACEPTRSRDHCWSTGVRVGEASHPGPKTQDASNPLAALLGGLWAPLFRV